MGELSDLKHNVQPSVFHEFLIDDMLGLLLFTCLFVFFPFSRPCFIRFKNLSYILI